MPASDIVIKGAREHNLRDVDLVLPRNKLICLTGVSGSGKSSLAFDTLYAEGQRRYVESLSTFARQFLGQLPKPDVDFLGGLSPTISISQKTSGRNPRSTVGTITEIYDYLRVLFARVGLGHCPNCRRPITAQTREAILARILSLPEKTRFLVLAPIVCQQKGEFRDLFADLLRQGFVRARVDGNVISLTDDLSLDRQMRHNIEVVVDRLAVTKDVRTRLAEAVETALKVGQGNLIVAVDDTDDKRHRDSLSHHEKKNPDPARRGTRRGRSGLVSGDIALSADYACTHCGLSFQPPSPQLFSFNSPQGMCLDCDGLGEFYSFDPNLLVTDPTKTFQEGCIEIIGAWKDLGRWKRHIYEGVAETMERLRKDELPPGSLLETPWQDMPPEARDILLWGTGDEHITFTWRVGRAAQKYGGKFEGIIPELLQKYRTSKSRPQINKLEKYMSVIRCPDCEGQRLNAQARAVTLTTTATAFTEGSVESIPHYGPELSLPELCDLPVRRAVEFFQDIKLDATQQRIAVEALKEIRGRLGFLMDVGLDYLTLGRTAPTLSGGESQRIRLAGQIGCGLVGVLYILDEPSIGLHARDNARLLATLARLRDQGNTVIVVEHDEETMRAADYLVDFGPGAGVRGGHVVSTGSAVELAKCRKSVTGAYLARKRQIAIPAARRPVGKERLKIVAAAHNNLKEIDVEIPLGVFVCVTGVSGSGKSSLVNDILVEALRRDLNGGKGEPGKHKRINGLKSLDKLIAIDQSPIGRTPRSNPATYIKVFDDIRSLYAQLPEAKRRGYKPGRFSFNVKGGRCEACEGNGSNRLEMDFLADVWVTCPVCEGHRFNRETLQVQFRGKSISDVLEMDIQEALKHFENIPAIAHKLQTLHDVGMDYVKLGQPSPTLSGGEAQRIKLARELVKKSTGRTLYLLDEPTTGLHFADIEMLLKVLHDFVDAGNTVLVVEHNLDVIKTADWIIDIGPEGGEHGGQIVAVGTPEDVAARADSHTGAVLTHVLGVEMARHETNGDAGSATKPRSRKVKETKHIVVQGARQHNLRNIDVKVPRDQMTVCCGPSGSGKSSLAMDTIYAEGQRRYVESLSSYARQFVGQMQKPAIEHIEGLSPSIAIEQRHLGHTPRSSVGTVTEIYDYFRILFARLGQPYCPDCDIPVGTQSADEIIDKILAEPEGTRLYLMAPVEIAVGEEYETLWEEVRSSGYVRVRIDGQTYGIEELPRIDRRRRHDVEVVVDRVVIRKDGHGHGQQEDGGRQVGRGRIADTVENALALGRGVVHVAYPQQDVEERRWRVARHSQHRACERCGRSFEELTPHHFSFNSAIGWCPSCEGLGTQTGANPAALLRDGKLSLADGAVLLWPNLSEPLAKAMVEALSRGTGIPLDVPYESLTSKQRRQVLFGTGDEWFAVESGDGFKFRCQYKGLYPALEEAARLSPGLRSRLEHLVDEIECSECGGSRLRDDASAARLRGRTIEQITRTPLGDLYKQVSSWRLSARDRKIAGELVREIKNRLTFLIDVGLEYLTLGRSAPTLSGGESQRIRLASQVGSGLCGVLYVLDEPTIGLHPRDNRRLITALHKLRDLGNTLLVVEHDREVVASADRLLDFGPAAGRLGGQIVAEGTPKQVSSRRKSVTGPYLKGKRAIPVPANRRIADRGLRIAESKTRQSSSGKRRLATDDGQLSPDKRPSAIRNPQSAIPCLTVLGARHHNLKNLKVTIPLGTLTVVAGVSGSGKSSLVNDILYAQLARMLHRARTTPGAHDEIQGIQHINKVIRVDQQSLGNTPTSNPATYSGVFELIRQLFAQLPDAKVRGFQPRRFSFNVPGGRCDDCEGAGQKCIEMHFLPDVWVECETCNGRRYNPETLAVKYRGKSIADVLEMSCGEAVALFENIPKIRRILQTLCDVGLDYVTLGQAAPTLSGGEAQRVKLAAELARPDTGRTLYLLDEPTTGLHFDDLAKLLDVLHRLVDLGNTVVVIEHNLDVMKQADWIIELGPDAGANGGYLVASGTPESVAQLAASSQIINGNSETDPQSAIRNPQSTFKSPTAAELAPILAAGPHKKRKTYEARAVEEFRDGDLDITDVGRDVRMPWETDGRRWHTKDRVGRDGSPCKWDGRILDAVERRIQEKGQFSATNWNARSVVEIAADRKSDGWFFHAITGEVWLLKMKFRVAKKTFHREELHEQIKLDPLDEMHNVPLYGSRSRVRCKNIRGPWQEVQIDAHTFKEIDTPAFWSFVDRAIEGFQSFTERLEQNPEDILPWKKLGQKWHLSRKGFPPGKQPAWEPDVLEDLIELLLETAREGEILWNNQQVVHLMLPQQREPWASVYTKRLEGVDLALYGPKDEFALGRIAGLGADREVAKDRHGRDTVRLRFVRTDELAHGELADFIGEHYSSVRSARVR